MAQTPSSVLLRSVEDLADAKELRAANAAAHVQSPMNEHTLRCAVWSFVGNERRAGVRPELVIMRLAGLIDGAQMAPTSVRLSLTRQVMLWCVEAYFGQLGGDALAADSADEAAIAAGARA